IGACAIRATTAAQTNARRTRPIASCSSGDAATPRASSPTSRQLRAMLPARTMPPTPATRLANVPSGKPRQQAIAQAQKYAHPDHLHARARRVDDDEVAVDLHRAA